MDERNEVAPVPRCLTTILLMQMKSMTFFLAGLVTKTTTPWLFQKLFST